jgi:hypothetical protein
MICTYLIWLQQSWQLTVRFNNTLLVHLLQKYIKHRQGYESKKLQSAPDHPYAQTWSFWDGNIYILWLLLNFHILDDVLYIFATRLSEENHRPVTRHWQTLPRNVLSSTPRDNTDKISIGLKSANIDIKKEHSVSQCSHSIIRIVWSLTRTI